MLRNTDKDEVLPPHDLHVSQHMMHQDSVSRWWHSAVIRGLCQEKRSYKITSDGVVYTTSASFCRVIRLPYVLPWCFGIILYSACIWLCLLICCFKSNQNSNTVLEILSFISETNTKGQLVSMTLTVKWFKFEYSEGSLWKLVPDWLS